MAMNATQLPPQWLEDVESEGDGKLVWDAALPMLERACSFALDRFSPEDLRQDIIKGDKQIWAAWDEENIIRGVAVTRIGVFPNGEKTAEIVALGGEQRKEWLPLLPLMERWAVKEGCVALGFHGRKGWAKDLKDWKILSQYFEKRLDE